MQSVILKDLTENHETTWRAMEKLYADGKAKAIGVSNWTLPKLKDIFAKVQPHLNQIEIHPFLPETELVNYCFSKNIMPEAYSARLAEPGSYHW